jgi:hypothetical protein
MNPAVVAKRARNLVNLFEVNANRWLGRSFIPRQADCLCLETSSICNLRCRFCAYVKKQSPKVVMSQEFFADCVKQAVDLGYRRFEMTPCTGDVFTDRGIFDKLEHLENDPQVTSYEFFTNFTIPDPPAVERLFQLRKLRQVTISVYGHDLPTFMAISGGGEALYRRLLTNLETTLRLRERCHCRLSVGLRSTRQIPAFGSTDLLRVLGDLREAGIPVSISRVYNNWGGYVTQEDVRDLGVDITDENVVYKNGACVLLLTMVQITASGIVNGCACRDVDHTLRLGDLNQQRLAHIVSTDNQVYMTLIAEQQRGEFRPICRSCDFYKSIYHNRSIYRQQGTAMVSLADFKASLCGRSGGNGEKARG